MPGTGGRGGTGSPGEEQRFDLKTRLVLSGLFMFVRAFATAVTVYSVAIVIDLITGVGFLGAVLILGVFTVVYDVLGINGHRASAVLGWNEPLLREQLAERLELLLKLDLGHLDIFALLLELRD